MTIQRVVTKRIGELLLESGRITKRQLDEALELQKKDKRLLGEILISMGIVTEDEIASCLAIQYGIPFISLRYYELDERVISKFPKEFIIENKFVPVDEIGKILTVAIANPLEEETLNRIEKQTGKQVQYFVTTMSDIQQAIERHYAS